MAQMWSPWAIVIDLVVPRTRAKPFRATLPTWWAPYFDKWHQLHSNELRAHER